MSNSEFHDEITLAEQAEALGKKALKLKLISSFVVQHFPDRGSVFTLKEFSGKI